jgi:hypothetical protein
MLLAYSNGKWSNIKHDVNKKPETANCNSGFLFVIIKDYF